MAVAATVHRNDRVAAFLSLFVCPCVDCHWSIPLLMVAVTRSVAYLSPCEHLLACTSQTADSNHDLALRISAGCVCCLSLYSQLLHWQTVLLSALTISKSEFIIRFASFSLLLPTTLRGFIFPTIREHSTFFARDTF